MANYERRRFYRLRYPASVRPYMQYKRWKFSVAEISEQGLRFLIIDEALDHLVLHMKATIFFNDGECLDIEGKILRIEDDEIILQLSAGIPLKRMISEQHFVIKSCPHLKKF
ncbi:MAG: PilZ domain-containing protein [Candidatus Xenobiia bacterium LiM19]